MDASETAFHTTLGKNIRRRRRTLRLTQTDLATAIGTRFQQLQKYESGINRVSAFRLACLAEALGCAASDLLPALKPRCNTGFEPSRVS